MNSTRRRTACRVFYLAALVFVMWCSFGYALAMVSNAAPNRAQAHAWTKNCQTRTNNRCEVTP